MRSGKMLITGGAGFFGGHICEEALQQNCDIVLVDVFNSETSSSANKKKTVDYLESLKIKNKECNIKSYVCDITDESSLRKIFIDEKPTIVIHAASLVMDRASISIPLDFINTNVFGSQVLINVACEINTIEQFIFISSRSAVGEVVGANTPMSEDDLFRPVNPYGATKASAEQLFHSFYHNFSIPVTIFRMNPMYGPRCRPDMFVWRLLNSIITGQKIEKYGSGEAIRDWLYVKDAVTAVFAALLNPFEFRIMNLGTGIATSTNELIELVEKVTKKKVNLIEVDPVAGDAHFGGVADCSKAKKMIAWESKTSLEDGIALTYDFMKKEHKSLI
jgi:nucleoside-diphosphate-sugar epimerase